MAQWLKKEKSPPANAGDIGDIGLIPGLVSSPGRNAFGISQELRWQLQLSPMWMG